MDKAKADNKPFFVWLNPTRMHIVTHLSDKVPGMRNSENGWSEQEAGMAQLDDIVGAVMKKLKDMGVDDNTIVVFTTDNGTENFTWPDGGQTPFAGQRARSWKAVSACRRSCAGPAMCRRTSQNGIFSGLDWFPTFVAAAGNPNIKEELMKGKKIGDRTYKNHLDGYNQMDLITGKGPPSVTKFSTSVKAPSARCALTTTSIASSTSPMAGSAERSRWTCPTWSTCAWIRSSARAGRKRNDRTVLSNYFSWFQYRVLALRVRPAGNG